MRPHSHAQKEQLFSDWDRSGTQLIYRGRQNDLPEFLPTFAIPLPKEWFGALFTKYKEKARPSTKMTLIV